MKKAASSIVLYGAGGHGKVVADAAEQQGLTVAGFLDDHVSGTFFGLPVLGSMDAVPDLLGKGLEAAVVSIGKPDARKAVQEKLRQAGMTIGTVIHPSAVVARGADISEGSVILPHAVVGPDTVLRKGCIINTSASVDHDCVIGDFAHIAPGAHLAGGVQVGEGSHIGIGSSVREGLIIGKNVMVGAGSVVVENLPDNCTAYGVPAKPV